MHLHSKAQELVAEIEKQMQDAEDENLQQALNDCLNQATYLSTRLEELGS